MADQSDNRPPEGRDDPRYVGNIWGWKFSYFSLVLILAMVALMWYRYAQLPPDQRQFRPTDEQPLLPWEKPKQE